MKRLFRLPICLSLLWYSHLGLAVDSRVRAWNLKSLDLCPETSRAPKLFKGRRKTLEDRSSASAWVCEQPCESGATTSLSNRNKEKRSGYLRSLRSLPKRIRPQIALQADNVSLVPDFSYLFLDEYWAPISGHETFNEPIDWDTGL